MTELQGRIPHALEKAHQELIAEVKAGIKHYKGNTQYSFSYDFCRRIERFVHAFYQTTGGREELHRRATLVETLCGPGSDYDTARARSLSSYRGQPRKKESMRAIGSLRKSKGTHIYVTTIAGERQNIEKVLNEGLLNLSAASRKAFESWRSTCRAVQDEAELLEVDGCTYLYRIREASDDNPTGSAVITKKFARTKAGGSYLESIEAAADSLVDWVWKSTANRPVAGSDLVKPATPASNAGTMDESPGIAQVGKAGQPARSAKDDITADSSAMHELAASKQDEIDTTPTLPKPPLDLVESAARDIPMILADGVIELVASQLASRLQDAGHTLAAAHWALHEAVLAGRLKSGLNKIELPTLGGVVGGTMRYTGGPDDRRMVLSGGQIGAMDIPKGKPTPFDNFKVTATEVLWTWWRSAAQADAKSGDDNAKESGDIEQSLDDYHPKPEWWLISEGSRRRFATDEHGRPVYNDAEWPQTGINTPEQLAAHLSQALELLQDLSGCIDPNPLIGVEWGKVAIRNACRWLQRNDYQCFPDEPPSVSKLDADRIESLLRKLIKWLEVVADTQPAADGPPASVQIGDVVEFTETTGVAIENTNEAAPAPVMKPKRSTERGEGRTKLIGALTKHHEYADDGCLNLAPIGNNELARQAKVSTSTASTFFTNEFKGHTKYRAVCQNASQLVAAIKLLNQEYSPHQLYGAKPPGEDDREADDD